MLPAQSTVVYGGSFNPPHMGHAMAILQLLEGLGAGHVLLVPSFTHPFGKPLAPFGERVTMCELLAWPFNGAAPEAPRVTVSQIEADLGVSRTYDVIQGLRRRHPGARLALAVGADILDETSRWYRWDELVQLVPLVVLGRQGHAAPPSPDAEAPAVLQLPEVSSREVRRRLGAGESIDGLVPQSIARFVADQGLYRDAS